jgi:hypothetical protein
VFNSPNRKSPIAQLYNKQRKAKQARRMSGQVAPAQADLNIDGSQLVVIENDTNGWPQTYSCQKLVEDNYVTPIAVSFFYDLVFARDADPTTSRQYFEYLLLKTLAKEFGLDNGSACISPLETYTLYPVMLSSLPEDEPNENLGKFLRMLSLLTLLLRC